MQATPKEDVMKFRLMKVALTATAAAALLAPGASAYRLTGDGGASGGKVVVDDAGQSGGKVVAGDGGGSDGQRVGGSGGSSQAAPIEKSEGDSLWLSLVVASSGLAALGAAGAAMTRRRSRDQVATLTL